MGTRVILNSSPILNWIGYFCSLTVGTFTAGATRANYLGLRWRNLSLAPSRQVASEECRW
jgi:hypothetical protein